MWAVGGGTSHLCLFLYKLQNRFCSELTSFWSHLFLHRNENFQQNYVLCSSLNIARYSTVQFMQGSVHGGFAYLAQRKEYWETQKEKRHVVVVKDTKNCSEESPKMARDRENTPHHPKWVFLLLDSLPSVRTTSCLSFSALFDFHRYRVTLTL
jgi:hypothetical protein